MGQGMQGEHLHILKSGEVRVLWREGAGCPNDRTLTLLTLTLTSNPTL